MVLAAVAGIVIGYFVFFDVFPGKPKIGIIDVPFTVLTPDAAFVISAFLDFARQDDDIKAVVSSGPHHQDSGEAKIRESTAGVSRKPSSDCKARGCSSKHLCGLTAWNT